MKIKKATAIYTGGGIYEYIAELENGNWIYGSDEGLIIVDKSPLEDYEECGYVEWQQEHLVLYIDDEDFQEWLNKIIRTILNGDVFEKHNFDVQELISLMKQVVKKKKFRNIKLYGGMTGEYEVIKTDAPNSAIKAEIVYHNASVDDDDYEWTKQIVYPIMTALGYSVECLGCQNDFEDESIEIDASFDYYDKY